MVKLLLDGGAKLTPTPYLLHYAILHQHQEMVELLLESGSLVNLRDNQGNTPLITAAISGQSNIVKLLLKYGKIYSVPYMFIERLFSYVKYSY
jgi:ankyrin repeat protein